MLYMRTLALIVALAAAGVVAVLRGLFVAYRGDPDGETWITITSFATVVALAALLTWGAQ